MSGTATLADVTSADWSLELDATAGGGTGSGIGSIVQALDDVNQCIAIILTTIPGEDPFRPTFGCDITQYLDQPIQAAQSAIAGTVTNALATWEPRITVKSVTSTVSAASPGALDVTVSWVLKLAGTAPQIVIGNTVQSTTVTVGAAATAAPSRASGFVFGASAFGTGAF
jgi:phage baseplate assembly protein W